jgi:predicted DNA-binding transcriptional regulator AlpA
MKKNVEVMMSREWLTLAETVQKLGKSQSTIERWVGNGALRSKQEPRQGRKPERLYSAADIERLASQVQQANTRSIALAKPPSQLTIAPDAISALRDVMMEWRKPPKLWLSLEEAAAYSGLSESHIIGCVDTGHIIGRKAGPYGAWRIHRASLEEYDG